MTAIAQLSPGKATARRGRERGFLSLAQELDDAELRVTGSLPPWLQGRLLLNGPALWDLPGGALRHWFDGYAMLHRLRIEGGRVRYRSRFVQSDAYRRSIATGVPVKGEFGSPNPASLWARLLGTQGTDNPAVVMSRHGARWIAVTETPFLTYFDPETLATEERVDLHGGELGLHFMAAHGYTLADGSYLNVGTRLGRQCEQKLFRVPPGARTPELLGTVPMARAGYTHAFALAPGYAILWECALRARTLSMRFGAGSYKDNFAWDGGAGLALHAVPLGGGAVRSWAIPPMFAFHATQAWTEGDDLLLELAIYDDATVFDDLMLDRRRQGLPMRGVPQLVRYRLRPGQPRAEPKALGVALELQQVHPARIGHGRARVCWGAGGIQNGDFFDRSLRVDLDSGAVTTWQRPGAVHLEPLFVPRPGGSADDDGVLLVPTLADDDDASVIGVVDAATMRGLAEIRAPQVLPFGFHAAFMPA